MRVNVDEVLRSIKNEVYPDKNEHGSEESCFWKHTIWSDVEYFIYKYENLLNLNAREDNCKECFDYRSMENLPLGCLYRTCVFGLLNKKKKSKNSNSNTFKLDGFLSSILVMKLDQLET